MKKTWVSAFGFIILIFTGGVWAAPVPDTGQAKCYNVAGNVITCPSPGKALYGQDANYTISPMSYTKLDGSGNALPDSAVSWSMVKDNVTGLIWENKTEDGSIHDKDNVYAFYDFNGFFPGTLGGGTTNDFIYALNSKHFGGFIDWRMPTIEELGSIINYNISDRTIDLYYFPNVQASFYWSSTPDVNTGYAWGVNYYRGFDGRDFNRNYHYVRAVRGIQSGGYMDNADGTVTDMSTGLMWQQSGSNSTKSWEEALLYCETLNLGNFTDWRLPAKKEMRSLVDFSRSDPSINTTYFFGTVSNFYWSSTTAADITNYAWGVNFYGGNDSFNSKQLGKYYVRAVRGGEVETAAGCTTTLNENFLLHIPYLSYINPYLGTISFLADFVYEFNPTYPMLILFKMTDVVIINDPSYLCAVSTLSYDLNIHIPDVLVPDGITHYWVDLEYYPALSTDGNAYYLLADHGIISD